MVYKFLDKEIGSGTKSNINEVLAQELHKPAIKKFKRRKVSARFKDNVRTADLAEIRSLSSFNGDVKHLLCVIDVLTKYAWVKPLKVAKSKTDLNSFIEIVNESKRKVMGWSKKMIL